MEDSGQQSVGGPCALRCSLGGRSRGAAGSGPGLGSIKGLMVIL